MRYKFMRWVTPALLALIGFVGFAPKAHAAWTLEYPKWHHWVQARPGPYGFGGSFFVDDTTFIAPGASKVDTTSAWSMVDADEMPTVDNGVTSATQDTVVCGYLMFVADSSVASSVNFKGISVKIQINYGTGANWSDFGTYAPGPIDGQKIAVIPLISRSTVVIADGGGLLANALTDVGIPMLIHAPSVRAIVTWTGTVAAPQCRIIVKKYLKNTNVQRGYAPYAPLNY